MQQSTPKAGEKSERLQKLNVYFWFTRESLAPGNAQQRAATKQSSAHALDLLVCSTSTQRQNIESHIGGKIEKKKERFQRGGGRHD